MWRPLEDVDGFNRVLVHLEQEYLAVLRGTKPSLELLESDALRDVWAYIDTNPYQAVAFSRIKSGHAMTPRHGLNVMLLARAWAVSAHRFGDMLDTFSAAALLHDLGHWRPDELVYVFGPFTHEEAHMMHEHAKVEDEGIASLGDDAVTWIRQHHEQPDGKGYPEGLTNPAPLAQMLRIVDCFDGLTTPRRFRLTYSYSQAMALMDRWAGFKYDAGLFQSWLEFMSEHPLGSVVELKDGRTVAMLPKEETSYACLVVATKNGDAETSPSIEYVSIDEIEREAPAWREVQLVDQWRRLRPDLMGLPRFYASVT